MAAAVQMDADSEFAWQVQRELDSAYLDDAGAAAEPAEDEGAASEADSDAHLLVDIDLPPAEGAAQGALTTAPFPFHFDVLLLPNSWLVSTSCVSMFP